MTKNNLISILLLIGSILFTACPNKTGNENSSVQESNKMMFVEYNVENLFDTKHDEGKHDEEFTPDSEKKWNEERYQKKLKDIAKVITHAAGKRPPELIALIEVENRKVLEDLIALDNLNAYYEIVHEESPDFRGIDVALIYNSEKFKELSHKAIKVTFPFDKDYTTRDILYTKLLVKEKDTLHTFINHWSSRRGGQEESEPKRTTAAKILRAKVDSIQKLNPAAKILISGDFNDEPNNKSIEEVLRASGNVESTDKTELFNLMYAMDKAGEGTYFYRDSWNMLDQIIVSHSMLNEYEYIGCQDTSAGIFKEDWMLFDNPKANAKVPNRTYGGPNYYGGFSDHLPVFVELEFR